LKIQRNFLQHKARTKVNLKKQEEAVIILQSIFRTHLAQGKIERKKLTIQQKIQADRIFQEFLVRNYFDKWKVSWEWKEHWRDKMIRKRLKYKNNVHLFLGKQFPAKEIFAQEGKDVMAKEYYNWRLKAIFLVKWFQYLTRRKDGS
jgi:hypothetical protein